MFAVVLLATSCRHIAGRAAEYEQAIRDLLGFEGQELRTLSKPDRERINLAISRVREPEFVPAYIGRMKPSDREDALLVLVEAPGLPEYNPPRRRLRIIVTGLTPDRVGYVPGHDTFCSHGSLLHADIVSAHGQTNLGDLLVLTIQGHGEGRVREIYAVADDRPKLVRIEDSQGKLVPAERRAFYNDATWLDRFSTWTDWVALCRTDAAPNLLAVLVYLTSYNSRLKDPANDNDESSIAEGISMLKERGLMDELLHHKDAWVREYASELVRVSEGKSPAAKHDATR